MLLIKNHIQPQQMLKWTRIHYFDKIYVHSHSKVWFKVIVFMKTENTEIKTKVDLENKEKVKFLC